MQCEKTNSKNVITSHGLALIMIVLISAVFLQYCNREDLYTFATDKHPVIYALTDTDDLINTMIIKANDEGFYKEESTEISSGFAALMDVDKNGTIYLYDGSTSTYIIDEDGDVIPAVSPISVTGSASSGNGTFIISSSSWDVYRFSKGSGMWDFYKTLSVALSPYNISVDIDEDIIYFMYSSAGTVSIYDLETETLQLAAFSIGPGLSYFERNTEKFYNCKYTGATNVYINGVYQAGVVSPIATDYTISDDGEVFAAENDGSLAVYRMSGSVFIPAYTFNSTTGSVKIRGLKKGKIAVGISGSDAGEDGLYVFNYEKGKIKKLSSRAIYLMYVR